MELELIAQDYFSYLPDEILLKILKQTKTIDVLNFCQCYTRYKYLLREKTLLRVTDFSKKGGYNKTLLLSSLSEKLCPEIVNVFNITNVYWVTAPELRKCLKKFENLTELYLIGTKIGISKIDCDSYESTKLKRLAIMIDDEDLEDTHAQYFPNLESLCVQINSKKDESCQDRLECLIKKLKFLVELWIHDTTNEYPLDYVHLANTGSNLRIFAFKALRSIFRESNFKDWTKIFRCERFGVGYYERVDNDVVDPRTLAVSPAWKVLNELHLDTPYSFSDAKKLYYGQTDINRIEFTEINFVHYRCTPRYVNAIEEIISSSNCKKLLKAAIPNCLFDHASPTDIEGTETKRKYNHNQLLSEEERKFVHNLLHLKKLKISYCWRDEKFRTYDFIQYMEDLTELTLVIPASLDGSFIEKVFENCVHLETLKVHVGLPNESFNNGLCRSISMAKNLRNFRYELDKISLEHIFLGLSKLNKMEKLFLKIKHMDSFGVENLVEFLKQNINLELMILIINNATSTSLETLMKCLGPFNDGSKYFFVKKDDKISAERYPIPRVYYHEIVSPRPQVSNINITEEFCYR